MKKVFHVHIRPSVNASWADIEATLNKATDWFRYDQGSYLVYSGRSASGWHVLLKPHLGQDGSLLVMKVDLSDYQGLMQPSVWAWLEEKKEKNGA